MLSLNLPDLTGTKDLASFRTNPAEALAAARISSLGTPIAIMLR
jgi:hypothetical protein